MVVILRKDNGQWAIPGGMVDEGEKVSVTLKREFFEEAQSNVEHGTSITEKLEALFDSQGKIVYIGYVDDPRNTDHAWMETVCMHFHIEDPFLSENLKLSAGDDAAKACWLTISDTEENFQNLYASHRDIVIKALLLEKEKFGDTLKNINFAESGSKLM